MLNEETRELRKTRIGGSDIGVILCLSSFKTREQLLREKVTGESDFTTNKYIDFGNDAEAVLFDASRKFFPENGELIQDYCEYDDKYIANTDGLFKSEDGNVVLEIKTTTEKNIEKKLKKFQSKKHQYFHQVQHYMHITKSKMATFVVYPVSDYEYENGADFIDLSKIITFNVAYDEKAVKKMYEECEKFLDEVEKAKVDGLPQDLIAFDEKTQEIAKRFSEMMERYSIAEKKLEELKTEKKEFEKALFKSMEEHNVKSFETNGYKFTRVLPTTKTTLDKDAVKSFLTEEQFESCQKVSNVKGHLKTMEVVK